MISVQVILRGRVTRRIPRSEIVLLLYSCYFVTKSTARTDLQRALTFFDTTW